MLILLLAGPGATGQEATETPTLTATATDLPTDTPPPPTDLPTETPIPPTESPVPPTETLAPPTFTELPPTETLTPNLTPTTTILGSLTPTPSSLIGGSSSLLAPEVSLLATVVFDQNFDDPGASYSLQGSPSPATVGFILLPQDNPTQAAYTTASNIVNQQVLLEVTIPFNDVYTVTSYSFLSGYARSGDSSVLQHITTVEWLDSSGQVIQQYEQCRYWNNDGNYDCPPFLTTPVYNVSAMRFSHLSDGPVLSGSIYQLWIDDIVINTSSAPLTPTPSCTAFPVPPTPDISQEAIDMQAIATNNGLIYHAGPAINAQRNLTYFLPWGNTSGKEIQHTITFADGTEFITWYGFNDSTYEGGVSWFVGEMTDGVSTPYTYITLSPNCSGLSTPPTITFPYDRNAAVRQGIEQTNYQNDDANRTDLEFLDSNAGYSRVTLKIAGLPYADFNYYPGLTHLPQSPGVAGSTGSAFFVSEMLWFGGMPMSTRNDDCSTPDPSERTGWHYCPGVNWSTANWRSHQGIFKYYAPSPAISDTTLREAGQAGELLCPASGDCIINASDYFDVPSSTREQSLGDFVTVTFGTVYNLDLTLFNEWIEATAMSTLSGGDYIFLKVGNGNDHGLLVVGWGPLQNCESALTTNYNPSNLPLIRNTASNNIVPYVVDFAGLPDDNTDRTRIQRTKARPFYCTRFEDKQGGLKKFGGDHGWTFYKMPENVTLQTSPANRIYVPVAWSW